MKVWFYCSMCGRGKTVEIEDGGKTIAAIIRESGWIVQHNGDNWDRYCSKDCAE